MLPDYFFQIAAKIAGRIFVPKEFLYPSTSLEFKWPVPLYIYNSDDSNLAVGYRYIIY